MNNRKLEWPCYTTGKRITTLTHSLIFLPQFSPAASGTAYTFLQMMRGGWGGGVISTTSCHTALNPTNKCLTRRRTDATEWLSAVTVGAQAKEISHTALREVSTNLALVYKSARLRCGELKVTMKKSQYNFLRPRAQKAKKKKKKRKRPNVREMLKKLSLLEPSAMQMTLPVLAADNPVHSVADCVQ